MTEKEEVIAKIKEVKKQIEKNGWPIKCVDLFFQGFATGSIFEHSYYQEQHGSNFDSLEFWGILCEKYR